MTGQSRILLYLSWPQASITHGVKALVGQCGGQQERGRFVWVLLFSTLALDTDLMTLESGEGL